MSREEQPINPYEPPTVINNRCVSEVRRIQVGIEEKTTVIIESSLRRGISTYTTDSENRSGPVHHGPCQFEVGESERHEVRITVDGTGGVNAYVDGKLVEANLFATLRARIHMLVTVFVLVVAVLSFLACIALLFAVMA